MKRQDVGVVVSGVVIAVLAGVWAHLMGVGPEVDAIIDFFTVVAVLGSLAFIYLSRDRLRGNLARFLEIMGISLSLYVVVYWLSYRWATASNPEWLGIATEGWALFFELATFVAFALVAYGFYLIWDMGQ